MTHPGGGAGNASDTRFTVARASDFLYTASTTGGGLAAFVLEVLRHPVEGFGLVSVVRGLPRVDVRLSRSHNGRSLRQRFARQLFGVGVARLGQAVLRLPAGFEEYLSGRQRRAVRNNVSRARASGLVVEAVSDPAAQTHLLAEVEGRRPQRDWWLALGTDGVAEPELDWFVVFDAARAPLAIAAICIDVEWAHLTLLTCVADDDRASPARYLLHTQVVHELIDRGVRYLNSDSGLRVAPGVRYLQHVLGYEVVNLRLGRRVRGRAPA